MKSILKLITASMFLLIVSCASNHDKYKHHHHVEFDKKCAYSVSKHDLKTMGKKEYSLEHEDKVFYFASKENKDKFQAHMEESLKAARENWSSRTRK